MSTELIKKYLIKISFAYLHLLLLLTYLIKKCVASAKSDIYFDRNNVSRLIEINKNIG